MKTCPLLDNSLCKQHDCEWWIQHDGERGCAVIKIVPELFEIRKRLVVLAVINQPPRQYSGSEDKGEGG